MHAEKGSLRLALGEDVTLYLLYRRKASWFYGSRGWYADLSTLHNLFTDHHEITVSLNMEDATCMFDSLLAKRTVALMAL